MKRYCIVACIALLAGISACRKDAGHLSRAQMAPIVADLQLADVYSGIVRDTMKPGIDKNYDSLAVWTNTILAQHGLTREEFTRSMDWYRDHPTELDSLFAAVVPILEKSK